MRNHNRRRGAALIETALVVGFGLLMLFETIQLGIVGFYQLSTDGASFVGGHEVSTKISSTQDAANNQVHGIFPEIGVADITATTAPAPQATATYVNYGYNGSVSQQASSDYNRYGGASYLQPNLLQTTVTKQGLLSIIGTTINVQGLSTEPQWVENGCHYHGGASQCDYFSEGENSAPYLVGFNFIHYCDNVQPWSKCSYPKFISLGLAEHLDASNWGNANPGIFDSASGATDPSQRSPFREIACHQQNFAVIAKWFASHQNLTDIQHLGLPVEPGITDFKQFHGFDANTDAAVDTIYSYDAYVSGGLLTGDIGEPQNALHPGAGC